MKYSQCNLPEELIRISPHLSHGISNALGGWPFNSLPSCCFQFLLSVKMKILVDLLDYSITITRLLPCQLQWHSIFAIYCISSLDSSKQRIGTILPKNGFILLPIHVSCFSAEHLVLRSISVHVSCQSSVPRTLGHQFQKFAKSKCLKQACHVK